MSLIVAADEDNGIGKNNELLCHLPADLKYFKQKTTGHHIVMGRKTYESIGRPLPHRVNLIVSRDPLFKADGCIVVNNLTDAVVYAQAYHETELYITGGGTIYTQALTSAQRIYLTRIHAHLNADTFFPHLDERDWKCVSSERHSADDKHAYDFTFMVFERVH
ncbi:MAG: dihydrofolate reductase [Bacteroidota bacterium]